MPHLPVSRWPHPNDDRRWGPYWPGGFRYLSPWPGRYFMTLTGFTGIPPVWVFGRNYLQVGTHTVTFGWYDLISNDFILQGDAWFFHRGQEPPMTRQGWIGRVDIGHPLFPVDSVGNTCFHEDWRGPVDPSDWAANFNFTQTWEGPLSIWTATWDFRGANYCEESP